MSHSERVRNINDHAAHRSWRQVMPDAADTIGRRKRQLERLLSDHEGLLVKVVRRALELASTSIILIHNHPSGVLQPSQGDTPEAIDREGGA